MADVVILATVLREYGLEELAKEAEDGQYASPFNELVRYLRNIGTPPALLMAKRVIDGEFGPTHNETHGICRDGKCAREPHCIEPACPLNTSEAYAAAEPLRAMYARLADDYRKQPTVPDRGGGAPGDRFPF